jgi:replicative DNA helicase
VPEIDSVHITLTIDDVAIEVDARRSIAEIARQIQLTLGRSFADVNKIASVLTQELIRQGKVTREVAQNIITGYAKAAIEASKFRKEAEATAQVVKAKAETIEPPDFGAFTQIARDKSFQTALDAFASKFSDISIESKNVFSSLETGFGKVEEGARKTTRAFSEALLSLLGLTTTGSSSMESFASVVSDRFVRSIYQASEGMGFFSKFLSGLLGTTTAAQRGFASLVGASFRIAGGFTLAYRTMNLFEAAVSSAFSSIKSGIGILDEFRLSAIEIAGVLQIVAKAPSRETFSDFFEFVQGATSQLEVLGATSLASAQEMQRGFLELVERGVIPETTKDLERMVTLFSFISLLAANTGRPVQQMASEIRSLLEGEARVSAETVRALIAINPLLIDQLKSLSSMEDRFNLITDAIKEFGIVNEAVKDTLRGQLTLTDKIFTVIKRAGSVQAYEQLVSLLRRVNEELFRSGQLTEKGIEFARAYSNALRIGVNLLETLANIGRLLADIFFGLSIPVADFNNEGVKSVSIFNIILDIVARLAAMLNFATLGAVALTKAIIAAAQALTLQFERARQTFMESAATVDRMQEIVRQIVETPIGGMVNTEIAGTLKNISGLLDDQREKAKALVEIYKNGFAEAKVAANDFYLHFERVAEEASDKAGKSFFDKFVEKVRAFSNVFVNILGGVFQQTTSPELPEIQVLDPRTEQALKSLEDTAETLGLTLDSVEGRTVLFNESLIRLAAEARIAREAISLLGDELEDLKKPLETDIAINERVLKILEDTSIPVDKRIKQAEIEEEVLRQLAKAKETLVEKAIKEKGMAEDVAETYADRLIKEGYEPLLRRKIELEHKTKDLVDVLKDQAKEAEKAAEKIEELRRKIVEMSLSLEDKAVSAFMKSVLSMQDFVKEAEDVGLGISEIVNALEIAGKEASMELFSPVIDEIRSLSDEITKSSIVINQFREGMIKTPEDLDRALKSAEFDVMIGKLKGDIARIQALLSQMPEPVRKAFLEPLSGINGLVTAFSALSQEAAIYRDELKKIREETEKYQEALDFVNKGIEEQELRFQAIQQLLARGVVPTKEEVEKLMRFMETSRELLKRGDVAAIDKLFDLQKMQEQTDKAILLAEEWSKITERTAVDTANAMRTAMASFFEDALLGQINSAIDAIKSFGRAFVKIIAEAVAQAVVNISGLSLAIQRVIGGIFNPFAVAGIASAAGIVPQGPSSPIAQGVPGVLLGVGAKPQTGFFSGTTLGVSNLMFLAPFIGAGLGFLQGGVGGMIQGGFGGLGAMGGAFGGGALSGALGLSGALATAVPIVGSIAGAIIGGFIGSLIAGIFKDKKKFAIEVSGTVEEILAGQGIDTVRVGSELVDVFTQNFAGVISSIVSVFGFAPGLVEELFQREIELEGGGKFIDPEKARKNLEAFITGGFIKPLFEQISDIFVSGFEELGVPLEAAENIVEAFGQRLEGIAEATKDWEDRAKRGELMMQALQEFLQQVIAIQAILGESVPGEIEKMVASVQALSEEIGFSGIPSLEELSDAFRQIIENADFPPEIINKFYELRNAIIQLAISIAQSIQNLVSMIGELNSAIVSLGGVAIDVSGSLLSAASSIQAIIEAGGLTPEEEMQLLGLMKGLVDAWVREQLEAQRQVIEAQREAIQRRIDALQDEKDRIRDAYRARIDALKEELRIVESLEELAQSIRDNILDLLLGPQSIENVFQRLHRAQEEIARLFEELKVATPERKVEIGKRAQDLLNQLLELSGEAFQQPSLEFRDQFRSVIEQLEILAEMVEPTRSSEEILSEIERLQNEMDAKLASIDARIEALRAQSEALSRQALTLQGQAAEQARAFYEFIRQHAIELLNKRLEQLSQIGTGEFTISQQMLSVEVAQLNQLQQINAGIQSLLGVSGGQSNRGSTGQMGGYLAGVIPAQHGFSGFVSRPTLFLAGEAGPERVRIQPVGHSDIGSDFLTNITINLSVNGNLDSRQRLEELISELEKRLKFSFELRRRLKLNG